MEGRIDPLYHSKYISGFISRLKFEKDRIKSISLYVKNGFAAGKNDQSDISKGIVQIRPTNLDSDGILKFDKNIYVDGIVEDDLLEREEILFNNTNSQELVGKTGYFDREGDFCCSNHITRIKVNKSRALPKYLKEILSFYQRKQIFYNLCTNWNNQSGVNLAALSELLIPLPPLNVQQQIINIMDSAYEEKRTKEKQARELLDSINDYLLGELGILIPAEEENTPENRRFYVSSAEVLGGRFDPRKYTQKYQQIFSAIQSFPFEKKSLREITVDDVSGNWGMDETESGEDLISCLTIRATEFDNKYNLNLDNNRTKYRKYKSDVYEKIALSADDILIEKSGGSDDQPVGRVALLEKEMVEDSTLAYSNFIHKIIVDKIYAHPQYVFEYLRLMHNIRATEVMQTQTNGIRNLIMGEYFRQTIILPDKNKQRELASEASRKRKQAKKLEDESDGIVKAAKAQVEKILLGE